MVSEALASVNFFVPVQEQMPQVEARMREQAEGHHPDLQAALNHLLGAGGKRVRPTISLLVGGMLNAEPRRVVTLAAAVELLHTATLVHDDLIDGALLRRGTPTINAQWTPAATILTGDFIFARAAKLAAETDSIEVMDLFAKTLSTVVNGEITQMFGRSNGSGREDYFERIYSKTASMFELAASAPVYLSDCDDKVLDAMRRFGYGIGMAFQIVDDILDFTSDQAKIGKPVASDLRQGLITLPALYYLENNPADLDALALSNGQYRDDGVYSRLVKAIRGSGAVERAIAEADRFVTQAKESLASLPVGIEREALVELADYVVDRSS